MTDEEMAEEYMKENTPLYNALGVEMKFTYKYMKQAFLAGLKAGKDMAEADIATVAYMQGAERYKPKWHKVADGDYPPIEVGNFTVDVLTDRGDIAYYSYENECWVAEPSSAEIDPPIAWCEIPIFKEM